MSLSIVTYEEDHLEEIVYVYNAETAAEPHIAPLTPERFLELVAAKPWFDPAGLFVALEDDEVVGWVHACVAPPTEPWQDPKASFARIRMLVYPPTRLRIGTALVEEATRWLKETGQRRLEAMHCEHGYPFYRGLWMGGEPMAPATMPHLQIAFDVAGYKLTHESIFMVAEMGSPPPETRPSLDLEVVDSEAQMEHDATRESWVGFEPMQMRALLSGEEVGHIGWVVLPHVADRLGADCVNIWSLGVREQHRRKGIASALVSRVLASAWDLGARYASVGTQLWNAPAQATYAKLGFEPYCLLLGRHLDLDKQETDR